MRTLLILLTFICAISIGAKGNPTIAMDSSAITVVSDTSDNVSDTTDSVNYVISTTVPRGFIDSLNAFFNTSHHDSIKEDIIGTLLGVLFGTGGILLVVFVIGLLLLPLLLLILVIWLLVRNGKRAKAADKYERQRHATMNVCTESTNDSAVIVNATDESNRINRTSEYTNRRDKAIRNIFIGIGLFVLFMFIDLDIGKGIGALVAFWGVGEYVIVRNNNRNGNK